MPATPEDTIATMIAARARNDVEAVIACYDPKATIVQQPGKSVSGEDAIRAHVSLARSLRLWFKQHGYVIVGDVALHQAEYTAYEGDRAVYEGKTADVLRRQPDGTWRILIDNPWA